MNIKLLHIAVSGVLCCLPGLVFAGTPNNSYPCTKQSTSCNGIHVFNSTVHGITFTLFLKKADGTKTMEVPLTYGDVGYGQKGVSQFKTIPITTKGDIDVGGPANTKHYTWDGQYSVYMMRAQNSSGGAVTFDSTATCRAAGSTLGKYMINNGVTIAFNSAAGSAHGICMAGS